MAIHKLLIYLLFLPIMLTGCQPRTTTEASPQSTGISFQTVPTEKNQILTQEPRSLLTVEDLMNGRALDTPVAEEVLTYPNDAFPAEHTFEGHVVFSWEPTAGHIQNLRGELDLELQSMPSFAIDFVQSDGYLVPVQRASLIVDHPGWNIIVEPGRVWQEKGDQGYSRASFPFALVVKGGNATFNGTMSFLFDDQEASPVYYQVTQETTSFVQANLWGYYEVDYQPVVIANAEDIKTAFTEELANRFPTKAIEALAIDYPGVDVSAFGQGVSSEHMTWYGFVVNGINYVGGCRTRFGLYPYCEYMRATSYSTAKSGFVSVALMRLAQIYGPEVADILVKDYLPETADSSGDWSLVNFNHVIDMSTGNYYSPTRMADEDSEQMGEFFGAQPYTNRIMSALTWPNARPPGEQWVYHTSDTFLLTRAMQNYLASQQGPDADLFNFVVDEVYQPLAMGPGVMSTMRTADNTWQGQAEGGYGIWWIPDDIAKLTMLLMNGGQIGDVQLLHPGMLAAALQQDGGDRGVKIDKYNMYNNAFWATRYPVSKPNGNECEYWVVTMQGVSGNVIALFPNQTVYYYFSDNHEFTWNAAARESDKINTFCP